MRMLAIIDTYSRECVRIEVDTSVGGKRVVAILDEIGPTRGWLQHIVVDNGPEFISNALD
jgi:putative transposase